MTGTGAEFLKESIPGRTAGGAPGQCGRRGGWMPGLPGLLRIVIIGTAMPVLSGCVGILALPNPLPAMAGSPVLHVEATVKAGAVPVLRDGRQIVVAVDGFSDGRPGGRGRRIGDVRSTVSDIHSTDLSLDTDVGTLLAASVGAQLAADGFRTAVADARPDFRLSAVVQQFQLTVAGRDELVVSAAVTIRDGVSGDEVWAGTVSERRERYAGVMGNSRATLVQYLNEGTGEFAAKVTAAAREALSRSYPRSIAANPARAAAPLPGVTTTRAAAVREEVPASPPQPAAAVRPAPAASAAPAAHALVPAEASPQAAAAGVFVVRTTPARAKVYVGDVYYGLSPLKVELPVGIAAVRIQLDGYKPVSEKVSIRRGDTTELELRLSR